MTDNLIENKRFNLLAPKDFAASSRFGFIWEKLDEMILYENGKKEIVKILDINYKPKTKKKERGEMKYGKNYRYWFRNN